MQFSQPMVFQDSPHETQQICPRCHGEVARIHRRPFDRLVSLFYHVWRYRCCNIHCCWEGNIHQKSEIKRG